MADITMCFGERCTLKDDCYRHTAPINEYAQAVFTERPEEPCKYFWLNIGLPNGKKTGKWWKHFKPEKTEEE